MAILTTGMVNLTRHSCNRHHRRSWVQPLWSQLAWPPDGRCDRRGGCHLCSRRNRGGIHRFPHHRHPRPAADAVDALPRRACRCGRHNMVVAGKVTTVRDHFSPKRRSIRVARRCASALSGGNASSRRSIAMRISASEVTMSFTHPVVDQPRRAITYRMSNRALL